MVARKLTAKAPLVKAPRRTVIDPAVADLLSNLDDKQEMRSLPVKERQRKAKEKQKMERRLKGRATYDLTPALKERIEQIAAGEGVPASQIAHLFLLHSLRAFEAGEINVKAYKRPTQSPRYEWTLDLKEL